jgi:tetratricopeptide (TPR) repeat protein
MKAWLTLAALGIALGGCTGGSPVVRVYDGRIVHGRWIAPEAYAAFLRGVLAEESGDLPGALAAYRKAAEEDDDDAAVWARIGEVYCKMDRGDRRADDAFARAEKADASYAGALEAQARCAKLRGKHAEATRLAGRAVAADPTNVDLGALLVQADAKRGDPRTRARAVALTVAHGERPVAWDALVAWGRAHHDAGLVARGLEGLVRTAPMREREVELGVLSLLGEGHVSFAQKVAASIADAPRKLQIHGPTDPTVARLAVDEALVRGDAAAAERRATRGHVPAAEVAARALLLGQRDVAISMAETVVRADPGASAAHMVLTAIKGEAPRGHGEALVHPTDDPPALCAFVLADRVATAAGAAAARGWLERMRHAPAAARDPLAISLAVDLAARGVLHADNLAYEERIELAARTREAPGPLPEAGHQGPHAASAKHTLLHLALTEPAGDRARALAARLVGAAERDAVIGFALTQIALAGASAGLERAERAVKASPANPLLLAAAVELARSAGASAELAPARARLMAVARTPAERALATE